MRRRSKAGGKTANPGPRGPKRRNAPKAMRPRGVSIAGQETDVARLTRERDEGLVRETANSEILRLISKSPGELEPVFQTILENATRICKAKFGSLYLYESGGLRIKAMHNAPPPFAQAVAERDRRDPIYRPGPLSGLGRVIATKRTVHLSDLSKDAAFKTRHPGMVMLVELANARTVLDVPMLKEDELIGVIVIYRTEVRPFTDKQIALVENFAAQAVIAIENARLLNELRESLDHQTATADILRVIAGTPEDSKRALNTIAETAVRMFDANSVNIRRIEGDVLRIIAAAGPMAPKLREALPDVPLELTDPSVRCFLDNRQTAIEDRRVALASERGKIASVVRDIRIGSQAFTPLSRQGKAIGVMIVARTEVRPFQQSELDLMTGFADQAVIAIENARLLNELRESLDRQTATADVLRIISSSPSDLHPVFAAILENATGICEANFGFLHLYENRKFRIAARYNPPPALVDDVAKRGQMQPGQMQPGPLHPLVRMAATKRLVHVSDYAEDAAYKEHDPLAVRMVELASARTLIEIPMLQEGELIGAIAIYRQEVRPFTNRQIELIQNFAAQAVIAIENARLLGELRQRTEEVVKLNQQLEQRVTDQVGEIERMGRLRRFLPPQVADLIVASGTEKQLESHRREITALFCDLRGFTGFSESSDPEDVMALLRDYHVAIGEIIVKYSGTLERFAGDGVMVIFNDPVPVENPALQAVLMALDMRTAIESLMQKWRLLGHDIGFGIGIAHGYATLGTIGFESRYDYAAIGTVSNVASRLCDEAKPGQILISPRVLLAVDKAVRVEPIGEFALKGIRRPMLAYNVLDTSPSKPN